VRAPRVALVEVVVVGVVVSVVLGCPLPATSLLGVGALVGDAAGVDKGAADPVAGPAVVVAVARVAGVVPLAPVGAGVARVVVVAAAASVVAVTTVVNLAGALVDQGAGVGAGV